MKVKLSRLQVAALASASVVAVGLFIGFQDATYVSLEPGPATAVSTVLTVTNPVPGNTDAGDPLITTVRATELNNFDALTCHLKSDCDLHPLTTTSFDQDHVKAQMRQSLEDAHAASLYVSGGFVTHPHAPGTLNDVTGIGGPSAGLTLTLYLISEKVDGDLFAGHTVAATGTINGSGDVGPVGGVALKAQGAEQAGADVFFVPRTEVNQVPDNVSMEVVGVETANDAVAWLCEHGATSLLCEVDQL